MGLIELYVLFALTTAIMATYELFLPSLRRVTEHAYVFHYPKLATLSFFAIAFVTAPILITPCLVPSIGEKFREGLLLGLEEAGE